MATALLEIAAPITEAADIPRKRWTREEYRKLIADGFLQDGKVELVDGEIWEKMGQGRWQIAAYTRMSVALGRIFDPFRIQSQASLPVSEYGDPEPDLAVLSGVMDDYLEREPRPEEMLLVVEISDSTLRADLTAKARQYGSAGIPEYWVVDIPNRLLHVFREPIGDGYASETILTPGREVRPLAAPDFFSRCGRSAALKWYTPTITTKRSVNEEFSASDYAFPDAPAAGGAASFLPRGFLFVLPANGRRTSEVRRRGRRGEDLPRRDRPPGDCLCHRQGHGRPNALRRTAPV